MKIRVLFCDKALEFAAVHCAPSWLERVLLRRHERDLMAVAVAGIHGETLWVDDTTMRRITDAAVITALNHARSRARQVTARDVVATD
jgi:hypothetical protein